LGRVFGKAYPIVARQLVLPDVTVKLAAQHRLPGIYPWRHFVTVGGLMCYAADLPNLWGRAASYVDQVLKGAKRLAGPTAN
jgi:ABC-type uncharacterized transport system substrate-binding protein